MATESLQVDQAPIEAPLTFGERLSVAQLAVSYALRYPSSGEKNSRQSQDASGVYGDVFEAVLSGGDFKPEHLDRGRLGSFLNLLGDAISQSASSGTCVDRLLQSQARIIHSLRDFRSAEEQSELGQDATHFYEDVIEAVIGYSRPEQFDRRSLAAFVIFAGEAIEQAGMEPYIVNRVIGDEVVVYTPN